MSNAVRFKPGSSQAPRSRRSLVAAAGLLALAGVAVSGCIIVDDSRHQDGTVLVDHSEPVYVTIDADQILHTDLGQGVGLFVEYSTGGGWRLWTSCDTAISDVTCSFDAHVVGDADISHVTPVGLGEGDSVELGATNELWFYAETGTESDAVEFASNPGASVELELWLDGAIDPAYIYWVGDGVVHEGAPDSPVVFEPNAP
jgi:hypothetical protein